MIRPEHKHKIFTMNDIKLKIGLEIHAQMNTETNLFSRSLNKSCIKPNENITLFDIGVPGILPKLNKNAINLAVKTGLAINGTINKNSKFDRKHYQYADLPFGYQITQFFHPIVMNGKLTLESQKVVRINRIHIECDAGKMIHTSKNTLLDYNRAGVPLMEIVTEPDMDSANDVEQFLKELILILEYINTCDCNMESGNLRVDVNLSLNHDQENFGIRVELKNLNSIKFIKDAIYIECNRQLDEINKGTYEKNVIMETRGYDSDRKITYGMRKKETYMEYRYFPDGNLPVVKLTDEYIEKIKKTIEILPTEKRSQYSKYLPQSIYEILVNNQQLGKFFDKYEQNVTNKVIFGNLMVGDLLGIVNKHEIFLNENHINIVSILTNYLENNSITTKTAKLLLEECIVNNLNPHDIINSRNLKKITDVSEIQNLLNDCIASKPELWNQFINGSDKLFDVFLGLIIKKTSGQVDTDIAKEIILSKQKQY